MKKCVLLALAGVMLCVFLTSCGIPKPPNEKEIKKELPKEITTITENSPFDGGDASVYDLEVQSLVIDKRQTNEKEDIAYVTIELENEWYHVTKHLVLLYNYYDKGGWILDDFYRSEETEVSLLGNSMVEDGKNAAPYAVPGTTAEYAGCTEDFEAGQITFHYRYYETLGSTELTHTYAITYQYSCTVFDYTHDCVSWHVAGTETHTDSPWHSSIEKFFTLTEMLDPNDYWESMFSLYNHLGAFSYDDGLHFGEHPYKYTVTQINPTLDTIREADEEELLEAVEDFKNTGFTGFNTQFDDVAEIYVTAQYENSEIGTVEYVFYFLYRNGSWDLWLFDIY